MWPWLTPAAMLPLSGLLWMVTGRGQSGAAVGVCGLAVVGLTVFTWAVSDARGSTVRWHATVTVAAAGGWLWAVIAQEEPDRVVLFQWWLGLVVGSGVTWNIRRALRGHGGDHDNGASELVAATGIARVKSAHADGPRVRARVQVRAGEMASALKPGRIASWLGLPVGGVRVQSDPGNAREAEIVAVVRDLLAEPTPWPGPSAPGECITLPLLLGLRESADQLRIWLPAGRGRVGQNVLLAGMTQAGKSAAAELLAAEVATRRNGRLDMLDVAKGSQLAIGFTGHPQITIRTDPADARGFIAGLPDLVRSRQQRLAHLGLKSWRPGIDDDELYWYRVVLVDEAASLIVGSAPFAEAIRTCLSAGMSMVVIGQRATTDNIPSIVRRSCGTVLQFGCVKESRDQDYAISEATMQAGAVPHHWRSSRPGYLYAEVPGVDPRLWAEPCRTFLPADGQIAAALGTGAAGVVDETGGAVMVEPAEFVPSGKVSPSKAEALFEARLQQLHGEGRDHVRPADFDGVLVEADRSKAWLDGALKRACELGVLRRERHGIYAVAGSRATAGGRRA